MNLTAKKESNTNADGHASDQGLLVPRVNIVEAKDAYILQAEMPGVSKEGLEVLLEDNQLTLIGKKTPQDPQANLIYRETNPRGYRRQFVLDPAIDTTRIDAKMENGLLRLVLPKAERLKPRKITVE